MINSIYSRIYRHRRFTCYEGEESKSFSQDDVNRMMADEKRKYSENQRQLVDEIEALKTRTNLTAAEREELNGKVEQLQTELLTKEEKSKRDKDKLNKEFTAKIEQLTLESTTWKQRYQDSTIKRSITDAAARAKAYNPEQVVNILGQTAKLVEQTDEDGQPNGQFDVKVRFKDLDSKGKPVTLELTAEEAVKRMTEIEEHMNLFKDSGVDGTGKRITRGKKLNAAEVYGDPVKYREARKKGLI